MRSTLRLSLVAMFTAVALLPVAADEAAAQSPSRCATTNSVRFVRKLNSDPELKLKFCVRPNTMDLTVIGRRFSLVSASTRVEVIIRDRRRRVVHTAAQTYGASATAEIGNGFSRWKSLPLGVIELPSLPSGRYSAEVRLVVDWLDDGKGSIPTRYKRVVFSR